MSENHRVAVADRDATVDGNGSAGRPADRTVVAEEAPIAELEGADFVTFDIDAARYAFPMSRVKEIIRMPKVVRVPLGPASLEGLANLRGRVLPVVNLRRCCALPATAHDETTRVIVVDGGVPLGFVVDRVASVISVAPDAVEAVDTVDSDILIGVIKATGDGPMINVLDVDRLLEAQFAVLQHSGDPLNTTGEAPGGAPSDDVAEAVELISFSVDGQEYALPIDDVQEIVQSPESVNWIPNAGARVLGVTDLRGRLLPVLSMRRMFGLPVTALGPQNRIVVVSLDGGTVGVVMDTVREVLRVPPDLVMALPDLATPGGRPTEVQSVCRLDDGKRLVSVLSLDRMFDVPGLRAEVAEHIGDRDLEGTREMTDSGVEDQQDDGRGDEDLFVVFRLDEEEYAVDVDAVQEIIRVPETLLRVPKSYDFVEGMVNLRGTVLPVVDLRTRLGLVRVERDERQRIVVLAAGGLRTGFVVDSVAEVARVPRSVLQPAPELSEELARFVSQVANLPDEARMLLLVRAEELLVVGDAAVPPEAPAPLLLVAA